MYDIYVTNREIEKEDFDPERIRITVEQAGVEVTDELLKEIVDECKSYYEEFDQFITCEEIQDSVEKVLVEHGMIENAGRYIASRVDRRRTRDIARVCRDFIKKYSEATNTANATIDDNSNVNNKNVAVLNSEIYKPTNVDVNRSMVMKKLYDLWPQFDSSNYVRDLKNHIIYKHDESTFAGAIAPYCASISMYPFLQNGLKEIGGKSGAPTNLDSFCGAYINLIFAVAAQFAGAVATSEFFICFDHFARIQFGEDYYLRLNEFYNVGSDLRKILNSTGKWVKNIDELKAIELKDHELCKLRDNIVSQRVLTEDELKEWKEIWDYEGNCDSGFQLYKLDDGTRTIYGAIIQYFQQVVYSINQPAASRGNQSAFVNFSYFDKPFFEGMFSEMKFPLTKCQEAAMLRGENIEFDTPKWESVSALQKMFIRWFNAERLKTVLTFPVESFAMIQHDGKFVDEETADFVAEMYSKGHSFFTYISDSVDSLSSCCRLKNVVEKKDREFSFTNGNMGVMTGSKSVITLNLNRITQNFCRLMGYEKFSWEGHFVRDYTKYLTRILERVYKYHIAYNECLWDMMNANLLTVYKAGMIDLNKQYLTIGINGLNEAAEFLKFEISDNQDYSKFCQLVFETIKKNNEENSQPDDYHSIKFNTECVPAESLGAKNAAWDAQDGYWVPSEIDEETGLNKRNIYTSYIFLPSHHYSVPERIKMHGSEYIGEYLDGGSACHINMSDHPDKEQARMIMNMCIKYGCQYFTLNIPYTECNKCGHIVHRQICKCHKCGSTNLETYDRIIGYLTAITKWSSPRQQEGRFRDRSNDMTADKSDDASELTNEKPP